MFSYVFLPLSQHVDGGFGATGDAYKRAADCLLTTPHDSALVNGHLPINFLYRHAVELYLKSIVIVLHHALDLPFGTGPGVAEPAVLHKGQWVRLDRVHSVKVLFNYFHLVVTDNKDRLNELASSDWSDVPVELREWIDLIDAADNRSTLFRYPSGDKVVETSKSSWRQLSASQVSEQLGVETQDFGEDGVGETVMFYFYDAEPLAKLSEALRQTADLLSGAHLGIRVELAQGR